MNAKILIRLGSQVAAVFSVVKGVRTARQEDDKLRYTEALVHLAAVVLTTIIVIREIRSSRAAGEVGSGGA